MTSQASQRAKRILIADDDPVMRHLLTAIVRNLGALQMALICDEVGIESVDRFPSIEAPLSCLEQEFEQVGGAERQRRLQ